MALQLHFQQSEEAYLKAVPTTLHEDYVDDNKIHYTFVQYYIYTTKGGDILFVDSILVYFDPNVSLYEQVYNILKNMYNNSISI